MKLSGLELVMKIISPIRSYAVPILKWISCMSALRSTKASVGLWLEGTNVRSLVIIAWHRQVHLDNSNTFLSQQCPMADMSIVRGFPLIASVADIFFFESCLSAQ